MCEPIHKLNYSGNTTNLFEHLQTCHLRIYSLTKKASQASQEEKAKLSASGSSSHRSKKITECFVAHEKYNSGNPSLVNFMFHRYGWVPFSNLK